MTLRQAQGRRRWAIAAAAGLVVALLLPRLGVPTFYVSLLTQTWIFAIVAMSLDLLIGFTGLVNFSQAALFGVGAYAVAIAATRFHVVAFVPVVALGIASPRSSPPRSSGSSRCAARASGSSSSRSRSTRSCGAWPTSGCR